MSKLENKMADEVDVEALLEAPYRKQEVSREGTRGGRLRRNSWWHTIIARDYRK